MSKYNHYARKLDQAFIEARKAFSDAYKKMQRAAASYDEMQHWAKPETHPGENAWHLNRARADYLAARAEFEEINGRVWKELAAKQRELTAALRAELDADSLADPGAVDMSALELMRSGAMAAADYRTFAERYADNATMRRLVAHYAQKAAEGTQDSRERAGLAQVARAVETVRCRAGRRFAGSWAIVPVGGLAAAEIPPLFSVCPRSGKNSRRRP